ncbi:hypothetical protein [Comamonas sp.]|uniref:hypothetical protein n=1 Tax=Comamonas sp. TaxID=34028 RepID=UPI0012CB0435|nr:hypothetical protein [Comamonas sp.]MPS92505.1 hypothetical protein [Comamonas sp.]
MPDSRIPPPLRKFWETTKELFSMDRDFPAPTEPDQHQPTAMEEKREQERLLRMRHYYRHW